MTEMDKIIERIRALRAMAENEASSPEEVATAAAKAAKLMMQHDLSEIDLQDKKSSVAHDIHHAGRRERHPALRMTAYAVGEVSECKTFWQRGSLLIAGFETDRMFAAYLIELILAASERGWKSARRTYGLSTQKERKSYLLAFGGAVSGNLMVIARERKANRQKNTGNELVPVKEPMIDDHMSSEFTQIGQDREYKPRSISRIAVSLGERDGDRLNLNRPIDEHTQAGRIE